MVRPPGLPLFIRLLGRPESFVAGTFAGLILAGAALLSLPISHAPSRVGPLDALFTSTSAVCVTGLTTVSTPGDFNRFGQTVILALIQCGGLGIMTFAALIMQISGHKISFRSQVALQDAFYQKNAAVEFRRSLAWIVLLTLTCEGLGTLVLFWAHPEGIADGEAAFTAVFHSISAFCNAGFSTFNRNLVAVDGNFGFLATVAVLVVLGGLGHTVLLEIVRRASRRCRKLPNPVVWTLNTRVVLRTTLILLLGGAALLLVLGLPPGETRWSARAGHAFFQSVSARTAGFNTVDLGRAPVPSLLWLVFLMFVGGSPGSCAGGIKTTSLAIWVARLRARLRYREDVTIGGRRIPVDLVRRVGLLVGTAALFNLLGVTILSITEMTRPGVRLEHILFEQISAFGTVGLSTGITPSLTAIGKLWIILTMYVGRLGPLTVALVVMDRKPSEVRLAEERLMIG
jgi:trk system potassium uptake protein